MVEKWLHCVVVLLHNKLFSVSITMLFIVTNFVLATPVYAIHSLCAVI